MNFKRYIFTLTLFSSLLFLASCQEVIDVDLKGSQPQIVIEGGISDGTAPDTIRITKTVNFTETNTFPTVQGAVVKISDDLGNTETLTEVKPGYYITAAMKGAPGHTYTLMVNAEGKDYTGVSTVPTAVKIDSLKVRTLFGSPGVEAFYKDEAGVDNFYRFRIIWNELSLDHTASINIGDDRLQDGKEIRQPLAIFDQRDYARELQSGDTVMVYLEGIDRKVYDYFRTLGNAGGGNPANSPANPNNNLTNGALGYFSAYSESGMKIVIP